MRFVISSALALAIVVAGSSTSAQVQTRDARADLKILNDPTSLDWEYYGSGYKLKPIRDPSFPGGGAAVQIDVEKGHDPFTAGANVHLTGPIVAGRDYVVRFWARSLSAKSRDGRGQIVVRFFRNSDPYPGFGDTVVEIGPDWRSYEVTGRARTATRRLSPLAIAARTGALTPASQLSSPAAETDSNMALRV